MQAALSIEQSFRRFRRFAWTSAFLSLLTGLSHVRTFPSYNIVLAVVALYGSGLQGDRQAALKSISVCAIIGAISIVADVLFCSFWAGETAMIYSSLAVSVAITSVSPNDEVVLRDEASVSTFSSRPRSADGAVRSVRSSEPYTPDSKRKVTFHSEEDVDEPNVDGLHPPFTPGVPGLVSPG
eukprot:scaffold2178_cov171-Alexandrium_tamarense.AAC.3